VPWLLGHGGIPEDEKTREVAGEIQQSMRLWQLAAELLQLVEANSPESGHNTLPQSRCLELNKETPIKF